MLAGPRKTLATSMLMRTASRIIFPLLLLFSIFLLVRGHNQPGGGFTAGLVATAAIALYALAYGAGSAREVLHVALPRLVGVGLLLALGSGILPVLAGKAFLAGLWIELALSGAVTLEVGTPLIFEVGVFLVVLGVTSQIVLSLAEVER